MPRKKTVKKIMPRAKQIQQSELRRYGYTRKAGGFVKMQREDLNRRRRST